MPTQPCYHVPDLQYTEFKQTFPFILSKCLGFHVFVQRTTCSSTVTECELFNILFALKQT